MFPIGVGIVVIVVLGVGRSVNWGGGGVIGDDFIFGGLVIFVGVMVGFIRVSGIFVGVERGGGRGVGRGVLLVRICLEGGGIIGWDFVVGVLKLVEMVWVAISFERLLLLYCCPQVVSGP